MPTFLKVNLKYTKHTFPVGQARCSFHLPHSYNLQILLARGNGASTNVVPWRVVESVLMNISPSDIFQILLLVEIYYQNSQVLFCCCGHEWVKPFTMKHAHILKSKPEIYKAYFPSGASKMQFSPAPQL